MNSSSARNDVLFTPFSIGNLSLANRIVMSPMTRSASPDGVPGENVAAYYRRRADSGLILTEGTWIPHATASNDDRAPRFYGSEALDGWARVVREVHSAGGLIIPQLWHVGLFGTPGDASLGAACLKQVGPSGYLGGMGVAPVQCREPMSLAEIESVIQAYGDAAANAYRLGFDGVALHGAHGYLIDQFFWKHTNYRTDAYGGDLTRRSRFAADVVRECRRRTHPQFPIALRISQWKLQDYGARLAEDGIELERILAPLADAGVSLFDCSQRRFWEPAFANSDLTFAGWVKRITGLPTMTVGSVGLDTDLIASLSGAPTKPISLEHIRRLLEAAEVDLVGVGRALLADSSWIDKIRAGRMHELIPFTTASLAELY